MPPILDLCHSLDPVAFARERLRFLPGPTQSIVLASRSSTRQRGQSTLTAAQAVFTAWHEPESLILVMSPTARQSSELVRKAAVFVSRLGVHPRGNGGNKISLLLPNGSRIVGLPGTEATDRGYSGVRDFEKRFQNYDDDMRGGLAFATRVDKSKGLATALRSDIHLSIGENCENEPTDPPKPALNGENQPLNGAPTEDA